MGKDSYAAKLVFKNTPIQKMLRSLPTNDIFILIYNYQATGPKMRPFLVLVMAVTLSGCAASIKLVDRSTGIEYTGKTGNTLGGEGTVSARVENSDYNGSFIYMADGGGFSLSSATATSGTTSVYGQGFTSILSAQGKGMVNMRSSEGRFIRCVFNFNSFSDKGLGECLRNDGRKYDLWIKR